MTIKILLTCNPGTEDVVLEEASKKLGSKLVEMREMHGRIVVETGIDDYELLMEKIYEMRTIHYAGILLYAGEHENPSLERIQSIVESLKLEEFVPETGAFAVKSVREGTHEFTSMDISRIIGKVIYTSIEKKGRKPIVRLGSPSVIFRADLIEDKLYLSVSITGDYSRHIKKYRVFDHPAALKSTLASVMLKLARAFDGDHILDPMCGSGTVAIEAAYLYENSTITCNDINPAHIAHAKFNAKLARVDRRINFMTINAVELDKFFKNNIDVIVSNPPYGIRMGDSRSVKKLYRRLAEILPNILSYNGRVSFITPEGNYMRRLLENNGFEVFDYRKVKHGDLWASIISARLVR